MSGVRYNSGRKRFLGPLLEQELPITLDPTRYTGAIVYANDGAIYYSNGLEWVIPVDRVPIARPVAQQPTNAVEQTQLRLNPYFSALDIQQTGIFFEVSLTNDFTTPLFTREVTSNSATLYQIIFPEDGLDPGQVFWWRGRYLGGEEQSAFSVPIQQTYPELITDPSPVTREGAVSGTVSITPYESGFGLNYVETVFEFYDSTGVTLLETVTSVLGATIQIPETLTEGVAYQWRAKYGGRVGAVGEILYTEFTAKRSVINGARSMFLTYDVTLAVSRTINLPLGMHLPAGGTVNVTVDWGDGSTDTYTTAGVRSKTYAAGVGPIVEVRISGTLTQYGGNVNQQGLVRVDSIGFGLGLTSLRGAFRNTTSNLTVISTQFPPEVTNFSEMFYDATPAADITGFDMSYATDISFMFRGSGIAQNLSAWDTSSVQNMEGLFQASTSAGPNCANWDVSSVTNVRRICDLNSFFNNTFTLGNWDSLTSMEEMFFLSPGNNFRMRFNQPINYWDVSNVTNMRLMFGMDISFSSINSFNDFNQPLNDWDVSNVTDMSYMFGNPAGGNAILNSTFNQNINSWNVSNVTTMEGMFRGSRINVKTPFNTSIADWDVSSCTNFSAMFSNCSYNQSLANWIFTTDSSKSINMSDMFDGSSFNNDSISGWNTIRVTNMSGMFRNALNFNQSVNNWNVSNVTNMSFMFGRLGIAGNYLFNQPLNNWDVSNVTDMSFMFQGANIFNQPLNDWDVSSVTNMSGMFRYNISTNLAMQFNQPLDQWDVSNVTDMSFMFALGPGNGGSSSTLFNQDISMWQLKKSGVILQDFLRHGGTMAFSTENYSKLLAGWAKTVNLQNGPYNLTAGFGNRTYNTDVQFSGERFETGAQGRAYLVGANQLSVSSAGDPDGDGVYSVALGLYTNANDWYFIKESDVWKLKDDTDTVVAEQQDVENREAPQYVVTWDGDLSAATVLRTGAVWTITDGGEV